MPSSTEHLLSYISSWTKELYLSVCACHQVNLEKGRDSVLIAFVLIFVFILNNLLVIYLPLPIDFTAGMCMSLTPLEYICDGCEYSESRSSLENGFFDLTILPVVGIVL